MIENKAYIELSFKKFLKIFVSCQLAFLGFLLCDYLHINILLVREIFCFIYLIVLPGILIQRFFKLYNLHLIEFMAYVVGLSLLFLMFVGVFINFLYPVIGIHSPISIFSLGITIWLLLSFLCGLCYLKDKNNPILRVYRSNLIVKNYNFFVFLLVPILSIFATYLVNFYNIHLLIFIVLLLISIIPIALTFSNFKSNLYPLVLGIMAISLLFHTSLISLNLWGSDIHREYFFARLVSLNSEWHPRIETISTTQATNSMLSIVMLAPIFSQICNLSLTWVFKIIYPFIYSIVPVILYMIYQRQTNNIIAFFSTLLFIFNIFFYIPMLALARQQIGELFFVLLILLITNRTIYPTKKLILGALFAAAVSVSHYGISYILFFILIFAGLALNINNLISRKKQEEIAIFNLLILLFVFFTFGWYIFTAGALNRLVFLLKRIMSTINILFVNPQQMEGIGALISQPASPIDILTKYLNLIPQIFIVVGMIYAFLYLRRENFSKEYLFLSLGSLLIFAVFLLVPSTANYISPGRIYHICLILLSPFSIIGLMVFLNYLAGFLERFKNAKTQQKLQLRKRQYIHKILSVFFAVFLLANSGIIHELSGLNVNYFALNSSIDYKWFNQKEKISVLFLETKTEKEKMIYWGDINGKELLDEYFYGRTKIFTEYKKSLPNNSYIFLRKWNIHKKEILIELADYHIKIYRKPVYMELQNSIFFIEVICKKDKIYTNGDAELYH